MKEEKFFILSFRKWSEIKTARPTIDNLVVLSTVFDTPMDDIIRVEGRGDEPLLPVYGLRINQTVIVMR
jgi:hypothetical protein